MGKFFKFGCLGFIGLIVIIIVIAVAAGGSDESSESSEAKAEEKAKTKAYKMNEPVKAGDLEFTVKSAEEVKDLKKQYMDTKTTEGKFMVVEVAVKNNDKEARLIDGEMFRLIGKDGTEYSSFTEGDMYVNNNDLGFFLQEVNPKMSKTGKVVFEVPNEEGFKLQVSSGFGWSGGKYESIRLK